ncbi:MoaD/ThiS family protein [Pelagicoccus sp. SDUM812005]|uniref:MoaD/ThiS family protein n=1 Tax=Pelagicoccus sp. SDUM812005 TaxID=3041257 RepID=UPI00280DD374|nr:MoaD/ThiS family protein [Pelagicoccus sp. SDUM812005]MDQ8180862.1 MoaD/ThiS family protein [Pelagicoccus sp. SDUM812005]
MPKKLTIQYFALLREQRGLDQETVQSDAATAASLYADLAQEHGFTLPTTALKVALNDDFADWQSPLSDGDTVVFIPPVAGG